MLKCTRTGIIEELKHQYMNFKPYELRLRKFFASLHPLRWPGIAIKFMVTAMLLVAVLSMSLFATIYLAASVLLDTSDIVTLLTTVVEKQTGGKLEIDKAQFDIFTGLNLANIRFFAPDPANPLGHVNGGPVLTVPLATIEALNINYDIPKILLGRISVNALQIVRPNFTIEDNDAITNFSGIIAYRTKNFPATVETPEVEPPDDPNAEPFTIPTVAIQPKNVYLPLTVTFKDIGVKNIGLSFRKTEKKELVQELKMQGIGLDLGANWHGRKSSFSLAVGSLTDSPISLYFLQKTPEKTDVFDVVTNFGSRFYLDDFSQINFDLDIVTKKVATPFANFTDLDIHSLLRTKLHDDFRGIHIEKLGLDFTRAFSYTLQGDIALPTGNPDLIRLSIDQFFQVDIAELMDLAKPFVSGIEAAGKIVLENLKIEGEIEPKKLQDIASSRLPFVSAKISLEDLTVNAEKFHASLDPLNGTISMAVTPALIGAGSQADTMIDLQMEQFSTAQKSPLGEVSAVIQDLAANVILRAMYPALIIPIAKVSLEIPHISVGGGKLAKVDVPLLLDLDADAAADLSKIGTDLNLEIGNLMALKASLDCRNSCEKFRAGTTLSLESLEALHAIAYPIAALVGAGGVMPTALTGSIDMQLDAKGTLPNPLKSTPAAILKEGNVRFNTQVTLNDVSTKMALNKLDMTELDTRFLLGGTLDSQKLSFRTGFKSLSLEAPGSTAAKPLPIKIGRFDYDLAIKNQFLEKIDLSNPIANLKTDLAMGLHIGEIDAPGTLPQPVKGVNFEFLANQAKLQSIEISKLELRVPDFGITANLGLRAGLDPDFFPNQLLTTVSLDIDHGGGKDILGLLRTAGKFGVDARFETKDMKTLTLGGKAEFKNFHVTVNGKGPTDPKVLVADGIDGKFPIKQVLDISEMIAALRSPPVAVVTDSAKGNRPADVVTKPLAETISPITVTR